MKQNVLGPKTSIFRSKTPVLGSITDGSEYSEYTEYSEYVLFRIYGIYIIYHVKIEFIFS